jgi:putative ABC transport system permease protein
MLKNYWLIAVRSLRRNKSYTLINFLGLTMGMTASLLLFLLIRYETSFDGFHKNKDRIYRVITVNHTTNGDQRLSAAPFPLANALASGFPQLETVAPTSMDWGEQLITGEGQGQKILKENIFFAGSAFFKIFDFGALLGDPKILMDRPYTAMLTKSTAQRFYGDWHSAPGKTLRLNDHTLLTIAGILQDPPGNTDFPLTVVVSYPTRIAVFGGDPNDWVDLNGNDDCYVLLSRGGSAAATAQSIDKLVRTRHPKEEQQNGAGLQPLTAMHYDTTLDVYSGATFSLNLVRALASIGVFLLLIACINFINLATAQAVNRSREVGVRKVLGSGRRQLVFRFLAETAILSGLALAASMGIALSLLQPMNTLLETKLSTAPLTEPVVIGFLLGLWAAVTVLAGVYPSLVLSGFNPVTALKSKLAASSTRGLSLRRALVVLQFVIAQVLITGVLVIMSQMHFFRHADLGFVKDAVITVPIPGDSASRARLPALQAELLQNPGVEAFSYSFASPTDNSGTYSDFRYDHRADKTPFGASLRMADTNYFALYHLSFAAGRMYRGAYPNDTTREFVINETCARKLGVQHPQDALGHEINFWGGQQVGRVVGVVRDFFVETLKDSMKPVVMMPWPATYHTANIRLQPARIKETLDAVGKAWAAAFPNNYYDYQFLDDKLAGMYKQEEQLGVLYEVFAGIAIFISCLGLYGLISFLAVQRNKEIGIRKVLGASVWQMVILLSREFTLLVLVAFALATPLSWYFMHRWLENYVYRITLGPGIFAATAVAATLIAWATVGYRALRAALANPAGSLRSE